MLQATNISIQFLVNTQLLYAKSLYNLANKKSDSLFLKKTEFMISP